MDCLFKRFIYNKGDEMGWNLFASHYSIIIWIIEINTALLLGFSLAGVELAKIFKKILYLSIFIGFISYISYAIIDSYFLFFSIFLIIIPSILICLNISFFQTVTAILLALTFDLIFIRLIEHNFFDILLVSSGINIDFGIQFSLDVFLALNNILIALIIYNKAPVLFPESLFEKQVNDLEISYHFYLYFLVFILIILNIGLYFIAVQLPFIQIEFRIFLTSWSIIICLSLLFFLRAVILYKNEKMQFLLDKQYQKDLLSFYNIIRSQRHDFNLHLNTIYGLVHNGEYASCKEYVDYMVNEARSINDLLPLSHPAVGAMLSTFQELASQKRIQLNFYIYNDLRTMPCSVYEMNKILGNLIQNAMEEAEGNQFIDSVIEVNITNEKGYIVLTVSNPTNLDENLLKDIFQIGYTTKSTHEGLGLPTVQKILMKYKGIIYPQVEKGHISFIVRIPVTD